MMISNSAVLSASLGLAPVQQIAESFIGQQVGTADFGDFGKRNFRAVNVVGAKDGYTSLNLAINLARQAVAQVYQPDPRDPGHAVASKALLVLKAGDRFALMQADQSLLFDGPGDVWRPLSYTSANTPAGAAIMAVIDGAANVVTKA